MDYEKINLKREYGVIACKLQICLDKIYSEDFEEKREEIIHEIRESQIICGKNFSEYIDEQVQIMKEEVQNTKESEDTYLQRKFKERNSEFFRSRNIH